MRLASPSAARRRALRLVSELFRWSVGAEFAEALGLAVRNGLVDLEKIDGLFIGDEVVDADDDFFLRFDGDLILVSGFRDFALGIGAFDGFDHAAESVDLADVIQAPASTSLVRVSTK